MVVRKLLALVLLTVPVISVTVISRAERASWPLASEIRPVRRLLGEINAQEEPVDVIDAALADLSQRVGETVTREDVASYSWAEQVFPDASLGCPQEGQVYAQVVTRGYLLLFTYEDTTYDYRATSDGQAVTLCNSYPAQAAVEVQSQDAPVTPLVSAGPITAENAAQVGPLGEIELQGSPAAVLDWSGNMIAVGGESVWVYPTGADSAPPFQVGGDDPVTSLAFDDTGRLIVAGGQNGAVRIFDASQVGGVVEAQGTSGQTVNSVAISPDGRVVAAASGSASGGNQGDNAVWLWSATNGQLLGTITADAPVGSVAFSPEGNLLAYGTADGSIHLVDTASGNEEVRVLEGGHSDLIRDLAFSPDGRMLASAGMDGVVQLWDVETGEEVTAQEGDDAVLSVAFSPDGSVLAAGGGDNAIHLWDVETGENLAVLTGHDSTVGDLAFSPSGEFLASISEDGTLRLWGTSFTAEG
jgi:WD40 repeat protein